MEMSIVQFKRSCEAGPQRTYRIEMKYRECICPLSWSVNTATLYVMVNIVKGVGVHPLSPHPHQSRLIFPS